jgi:hypothetical protein
MNDEFPQFRKLSNEKSYYRIDSNAELIEIQRSGQRYTIHQVKASILPERLLIGDLLEAENGHYLKISADEFEQFRIYCERELHRY